MVGKHRKQANRHWENQLQAQRKDQRIHCQVAFLLGGTRCSFLKNQSATKSKFANRLGKETTEESTKPIFDVSVMPSPRKYVIHATKSDQKMQQEQRSIALTNLRLPFSSDQ